MRLPISALACLASIVSVAQTANAAEQPVSFQRDVRPILSAHCFECHGADTQESNLRADRPADLLKGGKSGRAAVVPGHSADSRLLQVVSGKDKKLSMPPDGARLAASEIETLRRWIDQGASFDEAAAEAAPSADLWSFKPVRADQPPACPQNDAFSANPVDTFVSEKLRSAGLRPSPPADRRTLIRRLYLDVLGLPPSPEEIAHFMANRDPLAWNRLVDRVLASPHFGERWARHWLDVVRFAETDGFETNIERPNAWPYRDYLIGAFNDDKPYNRLVFEQLAGDSVGEDAATGFLVGGPCDKVKSPDPVLTRMQRQDELTDMINTTGTAFLGLTLGCAKCHNHKFDPIPQKDFYAVQAVLVGVQHGERPLSSAAGPERLARRKQVFALLGRTAQKLQTLGLRPPVDSRRNDEYFSPIRTRRVRFTILATNDGTEPCIDELRIYAVRPDRSLENVALASLGSTVTVSTVFPGSSFHKREHLNDGRFGNERSWISNERGKGWAIIEFPRDCLISQIDWGRDRKGAYKDRLATDYRIEVETAEGRWMKVASSEGRLPATATAGTTSIDSVLPPRLSGDEKQLASTLLAELLRLEEERDATETAPRVYAGVFEQPEPVHRLFRGDPGSPRERVNPGGIAAVGPLEIAATASERDRRIALANWITRPRNPLTARVMVNRLWHYHFGRGIVETPSDFGHNGGRPSHPELLDWLASELIRSGWSLKHVHRLILTSATYRQSSAPRANGLKADAAARLLWRFPPRRLEAEAIRDSMLAASGVLDERMGGPGFSPFKPNKNYVRVYLPKEEFGPAEWRRMVYMSKVRMEQDAVFGAFDCPDAGLIAPRRTQSTTAVQALGLFNSHFTEEQADRLAQRCEREAGAALPARVRRAFELAFGRAADDVEQPAAEQLVAAYGLGALCRALFNANEFLFIP